MKQEVLKIAVIGSGFAGISSAAYLAKQGYQVDVYEKNPEIGGRARQLITENGYVFDMGPSWYWMPKYLKNFSMILVTKLKISMNYNCLTLALV
ncbi:phytoene desaturase family protein [Pedobacter sp. NJ-S-72]